VIQLDRDVRALDHHARLERRGRIAVGVEAEPGHQGHVDEVQAREAVARAGRNVDGLAGNEQPLERARAVRRAGNVERRAEHERRPALLGGAHDDVPAGLDRDRQVLLVAAAVGDLHHPVAAERGERRLDRGVVAGHAQHRRPRRIERAIPRVLAAAHVGREAVVVCDLHARRHVLQRL
jgi:hypothetical protein